MVIDWRPASERTRCIDGSLVSKLWMILLSLHVVSIRLFSGVTEIALFGSLTIGAYILDLSMASWYKYFAAAPEVHIVTGY